MNEQTGAELQGQTDQRISCALDLGWRIAALHAGVMAYHREPSMDGLLPTATTLPACDRLELELRAAVGHMQRLGIAIDESRHQQLESAARKTNDAGDEAENKFREVLRECHVRLDKEIWSKSESEGRAYELGIMLFDTWGRLRRAHAACPEHDDSPVTQEWENVFGEGRVKDLLTLIDDLQSRLDPAAVTVVRDNIESWGRRVGEVFEKDGPSAAPDEDAWQEVRSQTLVWRQLLSGDKEPEAYLGPRQRAHLRAEMSKLMWRRFRPLIGIAIPTIAVSVFVAVRFGGAIFSWYEGHTNAAAIAIGLAASAAAVFGITKASIVHAARNSMSAWSELVWNRALARAVCRETLMVDNVFPGDGRLRRRVARRR